MKPATFILTCAAGLAIGAIAGRSLHSSGRAGTAETRPAHDAPPVGVNERSRSASAFATSDDDRIAQLFTALKEPLSLVQHYELFEAMRAFTAADLPGLVKRAEALPLELKSELMLALMTRWFTLDPAAAERWMLEHPDFAWGVEPWARAMPDAAIRAALAAPGNARSRKLIAAAITQLGGKEPQAQAAQLREFPPGALREKVFADILGKWADTDPAAAFASLADMAPGSTRDETRETVLRKWAKKDPKSALAQLEALLPRLEAGAIGNPLVTHVAEVIGGKDPRLVLEWLTGIPAEFRDQPAIAAAKMWAAKEPIAALEWCLASGVEAARGVYDTDFNSWYPSVLAEAMKGAPAKTVAWMEAMPAGPERERLMERALYETFSRLSSEELETPGGNMGMRLFNQLPDAAQFRLANRLGFRIGGGDDFTDLNAWGQSFKPGPIRSEAIAGAMSAAYMFSRQDPKRAEAMLAAVSNAAEHDAALRGLLSQMAHDDPAAVAPRALTIRDSTSRREVLDNVIYRWRERDAAAAHAWLESETTIPPAWKAEWLKDRKK